MTTLYAIELYVVATGVVGMLLLRRASDRAWVAHRRAQVRVRVDGAVRTMARVDLGFDRFVASMARLTAQMPPVWCDEHMEPYCPRHDQ